MPKNSIQAYPKLIPKWISERDNNDQWYLNCHKSLIYICPYVIPTVVIIQYSVFSSLISKQGVLSWDRADCTLGMKKRGQMPTRPSCARVPKWSTWKHAEAPSEACLVWWWCNNLQFHNFKCLSRRKLAMWSCDLWITIYADHNLDFLII